MFDADATRCANTISDLEPITRDLRKRLCGFGNYLHRCITYHDFSNHFSLMLGLLTEQWTSSSGEKKNYKKTKTASLADDSNDY